MEGVDSDIAFGNCLQDRDHDFLVCRGCVYVSVYAFARERSFKERVYYIHYSNYNNGGVCVCWEASVCAETERMHAEWANGASMILIFRALFLFQVAYTIMAFFPSFQLYTKICEQVCT